jgi:two-component system response regulator ResD
MSSIWSTYVMDALPDEMEQPQQTILIIEDEKSISQLVQLYLEQANYRVVVAADGPSGLGLHTREQPALVILDLMLPGLDGWEVCRRIRQQSSTPVLMLTARQTEEDRIQGLDLGADDYVTKPFSPRELVSRIRAILRRTAPSQADEQDGSATLSYPGLSIFPAARRVEVRGQAVTLTAKEFDLLLLFARTPDTVFTREELLSRIWGYDYLGDSRTVDVHIGTLRKKIESNPTDPRFIKTLYRVGYIFDSTGVATSDNNEAPETS